MDEGFWCGGRFDDLPPDMAAMAAAMDVGEGGGGGEEPPEGCWGTKLGRDLATAAANEGKLGCCIFRSVLKSGDDDKFCPPPAVSGEEVGEVEGEEVAAGLGL